MSRITGIATDRAVRLRDFVDAARDLAVTVGRDDCAPWVAAWIARECGQRVALPDYQTRDNAAALITKAGSFERAVRAVLAPLLSETHDPQPGDVAVIRLSDREVPAIVCFGGYMAVRGEHSGFSYIRPRSDAVLAAYTVPECPPG